MNRIALSIAAAVMVACLGAPASRADISNLPPDVVAGLAALGPNLNPDVIAKTGALMKPLVSTERPAGVQVTTDLIYGDDPLQKIDIYKPAKGKNLPIVLFVHGGGFVGGDKNAYGQFYGNVTAYLASRGIVGVNVDYRLAPKVTWPAASQDVGAVVAYMRAHAAAYGGDPKRIIIMGHSAGANIVASYVLDPAVYPKGGPGVVAAILVSGPAYRAESLSKADHVYYGEDASLYAKRVPGAHLKQSKLPLMIVTTEFDPVSLAPESYDLAAKVCVRDGKCPAFLYIRGHNHISEMMSIGSKDDQFARPLVDFIRSTK